MGMHEHVRACLMCARMFTHTYTILTELLDPSTVWQWLWLWLWHNKRMVWLECGKGCTAAVVVLWYWFVLCSWIVICAVYDVIVIICAVVVVLQVW